MSWGKPIDKIPRKLEGQYAGCLEAFLESDDRFWELDMSRFSTSNTFSVYLQLRDRIGKDPRFEKIRVIKRKEQVYLENIAIQEE